MTVRFKVGDHVTWNSEAGHVSGKVIKVHEKDTEYKGYAHHASPDDPQIRDQERQKRPHRHAQGLGAEENERLTSAVADAHHVVAKQRLLILDLLQKNAERVTRIEHTNRPAVGAGDRNVL